MHKIRIVVMDTGIQSNEKIANNIVESYALQKLKDGWQVVRSQVEDKIGHGTAVANIICSVNPNVEIINLRICDAEAEVDEVGLVYALEYVYRHLDVKLINISAGITFVNDVGPMALICSKLADKNVLIVSAFDNDGALSYPAALDNVIGIDVERSYLDKHDITLVTGKSEDLIVADRYYRTMWLKKPTIIKGTSFACAYITGRLSLLLESYRETDKGELLGKLANRKVECCPKTEILRPTFVVKKAIVFPVNKESHALLRFKNQLNFEIVGVYDDRVSGKIGSNMFGIEIEAYENIVWDSDFDTIILSVVTDLERISRRDYINEFLSKATQYGKNVYSLESICSNYNNYFYPSLSKRMIPTDNRNKLHKISIPVVGVFGTSSKQGKFTLQREIIQQLKYLGYDTGFISTEPSGYLFDADYVFHFGYKADIQLQPWECILILNEMVWNTQLKQKDILITGCQSSIVHYNDSNVNDFPIYQYAFLLGTMPDVYVLCVNPHDDQDYIGRTIQFLNSVSEGKVVAIAIFPMMAKETLTGIGYKITQATEQELSELKQILNERFGVLVIQMGLKDELERLCEYIIDEFTNNEIEG